MANLIAAPAIPTLSVGGRVFTDLSNLIVLSAYSLDNTNLYCTARLATGSAGYAVTASKTLKVLAIRAACAQAVGITTIAEIGYADNDVGVSVTTVPTNLVYSSGITAMSFPLVNTVATPVMEAVSGFTVPAGKYLFIRNRTAGQIQFQAFCYEV